MLSSVKMAQQHGGLPILLFKRKSPLTKLGLYFILLPLTVVVMKTPVNRIVKVVHSLAVNEPRGIEKSKGNNLKENSRGGNLMILSYMRSGSSMNGQVFSDNAENFYVYEPLIKLAPYHYLTEDHLCEMRTMKCR